MAVKLRGAGSIPAAAFSKAVAYFKLFYNCSLNRKIVTILNNAALGENGIDKVSKSSQLVIRHYQTQPRSCGHGNQE